MELKRLAASFGRLKEEELTLHPGLNIIEAPNESGKSTWAAFIRAMLYGVDSSARTKAGILPDKKRYLPWSGASMAGFMELSWQGQEVTLRRSTSNAARPMADLSAVYTGTEEAVPALRKGVPGETMLGVTEPVYRRSAFISGDALGVDANSDLEKRITKLVTTGEERASYTEADDRLRRWQRKRRWRNSGLIPEAEGKRQDIQQKLYRIENENQRLSSLREQAEKLAEQQSLLEIERKLHVRDERRAILRQHAAAEQAYADAVRESAAADETLRALRERVGGLKPEQITALREAQIRWQEAEHDRHDAEAVFQVREKALNDLPAPEKLPNPKKKPMLALFILGALLLLGGGASFLLPLPIGAACALLGAGLVLLVVGFLLLSAGRKLIRAAELEAAHQRELVQQAKDDAEAYLTSCTEETDGWRTARTKALAALGAEPEADPMETAQNAEALLSSLREAELNAESASKLAQRLTVAPLPPMEPIPEDGMEGTPRFTKAETEDYLVRTRERLRTVRRDLDRSEGLFDLLGDPMVLGTEEARLKSDIERYQAEFDALDIAADALRQANARLQTLFSPLISRRAAALMARMTDSAYAGVYFDREMHFAAQRSGDVDVRQLEYLSDGTRSQLYLAVRLAICELLLPKDEPCPLILDDVLLTFDDHRAKDTLRLLKELSRDRQILLFTCQSREQRLLRELEEEECPQP